ncbi:MAG TPA: O-methyltransferase [Thermoleophilaceae bacterium]|nr:O-methyltransferase [Thermoleophilaceae bacterium]
MAILHDHVEGYLRALRPDRDPVMAEMEVLAERDSVPIVHWEAGRFLATLCRGTDPRVLEVGTAIGYSALHMAQALENGKLVTLEIDPARAATARKFLDDAGVGDRVEIVEGDARQTIPNLGGPFDLLFIDAKKDQYREYLELAEPLLAERALLVVDNLLMSGEVALPHDADTYWADESLAAARAFNSQLLQSERWLGSVLPIGDGVGFAARLYR